MTKELQSAVVKTQEAILFFSFYFGYLELIRDVWALNHPPILLHRRGRGGRQGDPLEGADDHLATEHVGSGGGGSISTEKALLQWVNGT